MMTDLDKSIWQDESVPKIVVCGLKRSGKSSILRVLFNKLSPHETMYLESTSVPTFVNMMRASKNPLLNVAIAEIPGNWGWEESESIDSLFFANCQSLIIVIDSSSSEEISPAAISLAKRVIARANKVKQNIHLHIFLNKVDANFRFDPDSVQAETNKAKFMEAVLASIDDSGNISAHCTSIFDNSIHEAFSKVIQKPLLANGKIEQILDVIVTSCRLEKAVLFDLVSKLTLGSDSSQIESNTFALMQDLLDVIADMIGIYSPVSALAGKTNCNIALSNGEVIYVRIIQAPHLALVCIVKAEMFEKTFLLNHNIDSFRNSLMRIVSFT